ncbi:hypothetical protein GA0115233_114312, partial [Streptomyces sp. DI166]
MRTGTVRPTPPRTENRWPVHPGLHGIGATAPGRRRIHGMDATVPVPHHIHGPGATALGPR